MDCSSSVPDGPGPSHRTLVGDSHTWNHVALTVNGSAMKLFIEGKLDTSYVSRSVFSWGSNPTDCNTTWGDFVASRAGPGLCASPSSALKDVAWLDDALPEDAIPSLIPGPPRPPPPPPPLPGVTSLAYAGCFNEHCTDSWRPPPGQGAALTFAEFFLLPPLARLLGYALNPRRVLSRAIPWSLPNDTAFGPPSLISPLQPHVGSVAECEGLALAAGCDVFALQYGGQCFGCRSWERGCDYAAYGAALPAACPPLGGNCTNQVYLVTAVSPPPSPPSPPRPPPTPPAPPAPNLAKEVLVEVASDPRSSLQKLWVLSELWVFVELYRTILLPLGVGIPVP